MLEYMSEKSLLLMWHNKVILCTPQTCAGLHERKLQTLAKGEELASSCLCPWLFASVRVCVWMLACTCDIKTWACLIGWLIWSDHMSNSCLFFLFWIVWVVGIKGVLQCSVTGLCNTTNFYQSSGMSVLQNWSLGIYRHPVFTNIILFYSVSVD